MYWMDECPIRQTDDLSLQQVANPEAARFLGHRETVDDRYRVGAEESCID